MGLSLGQRLAWQKCFPYAVGWKGWPGQLPEIAHQKKLGPGKTSTHQNVTGVSVHMCVSACVSDKGRGVKWEENKLFRGNKNNSRVPEYYQIPRPPPKNRKLFVKFSYSPSLILWNTCGWMSKWRQIVSVLVITDFSKHWKDLMMCWGPQTFKISSHLEAITGRKPVE